MPTLCLAEAAHFVGTRVGWRSEIGLLAAMESAELTLAPLEPSDLARVAELMYVYRDLPLGAVDASVIAAAERWGATTIATLDRRHFRVVRPAHVEAFALVP